MAKSNLENLVDSHSREAIHKKLEAPLKEDNFLGDFLLGAVDGAITTFALVAGVAGAGMDNSVALILGIANLVADGFSMAASNYQSARSDTQLIQKARSMEEEHIDLVPDGEKEEVRQIYAKKGFEGELLEKVVEVITKDRNRWIDTMIMEEFGMQLTGKHPLRSALITFLAFVFIGFFPLLPFVMPLPETLSQFQYSITLTGLCFFAVGAIKGHVVNQNKILNGLETLLIGGLAAALAYFSGSWLKDFVN